MAKNSRSKFSRLFNPLGLNNNSSGGSAQTTKKPFKLTWKKALRFGLIGVNVLAVAVALMLIIFSFQLPSDAEIAQYKPTASTKIYDRNGVLLQDVSGDQKRTVIDSKDIPQALKDATVAIEDRSFYTHGGIDIRAILRSIAADIIRHRTSQGGSTITQQLVRNAFDDIGTKKNVIRKIKEAMAAIKFERTHTKDQILTLYMNEIPYGGNNYGIQSAAQTYYNKSAKDLDPNSTTDPNEKAKIYAQIATLVALPQSPTYYNLYGTHTDQTKTRRNTVLDKMVQQGYLKQDVADKAKSDDIADGLNKTPQNILAPHFVYTVREQLVDLFGGGTEGERKLASGGYKITTTLDIEKQKAAEKIIANDAPGIFKSTKASNAALVSTDATNGQVLAMVGSVDFNNKQFGSVNVTTSQRQPGSSFKPLVYATLFKKGWSPGSTLFDLEGHYDQSTPNVVWPHDYNGGDAGPLTVRGALARSENIAAIKAQALAGTPDSVNTAKDLGISTLSTPDKYGLAMVLGAAEVKMVDMVGAYGAFGDGGVLHPTSMILKVEDNRGQVVQEWKDQPKNVLDPGIAYEITDILKDNDAKAPVFGSRSPLYFSDRQVADKTGTTSDFRDAWTIGYTPQVVTAVWVGNNDNAQMTHSGAGAMAAAPIFHDYMVQAHKDLKPQDFTKPDSVKDCSLSRYSNKKPTNSTPSGDVVNDICLDSQMPTQPDDTHQVVKVYKLDQSKLATDQTPAALTIDKVFTVIHSERPNDPVWEGPVLAWAQAAGISSSAIPTDKYDPNANDKLTASIVTPVDGSTVNGTIDLHATAQSPFGVSLMTFFIDDKQVAQPNAPWAVPYDTTQLADGAHTFKAEAKDLQDQVADATVHFTVNNDAASPLTVSGAVGTRSADHLSATITWTTNKAADGLVSYGATAAYGTQINENRGTVTSHTLTITGLNPLATYHFQVTSKTATQTASSPDGVF